MESIIKRVRLYLLVKKKLLYKTCYLPTTNVEISIHSDLMYTFLKKKKNF